MHWLFATVATVDRSFVLNLNDNIPQSKKAALTMSKRTKAHSKVKEVIKVFAQHSVLVLDQGVVTVKVGARRTATCTITLPQRYV